jgi:molecular chaperone Hsp33
VASPGEDSVLRAMTDDGAFRVVTVRMTDTVSAALATQHARGRDARRFGELLVGSVLVRETMAPGHRVQALIHARGQRSRLVADAHPDGTTRGLWRQGEDDAEVDLAGGSLEMMRTLYSGELHRGVVAISGSGNLSTALMTYMASSEQVASMIAVGCVLEGEQVRAAGGYIVQLLPEVGRGPLMVMTERLRDFENVDELLVQLDADPSALLDELLYGMPFTRLEQSALRYGCHCSALRVMSTLASLGRAQLLELVRGGAPIELGCDYCGKQYAVNPTELSGLLQQS